MATKVTVWTLNRATDLADRDLGNVKAKLEGNLFNGGFQSVAGDRRPFTVADSVPKLGVEHHQLMYEQDDFNEYFVSVEVKCIGDMFDPSALPVGPRRDILEGSYRGTVTFQPRGSLLIWTGSGSRASGRSARFRCVHTRVSATTEYLKSPCRKRDALTF